MVSSPPGGPIHGPSLKSSTPVRTLDTCLDTLDGCCSKFAINALLTNQPRAINKRTDKMGICMSAIEELTEPPFMTPTVKLEKCEAGEMSLLHGMSVNLSLRIRNPNKKSLMMDVVTYKIAKESDGTVLADDTAIKRELFRGESEKVVTLPIKVSYFGMGASAQSILVKGSTKLDITGTVTFEAAPATGDKEIDVRFSGDWMIETG